MVPQEKMVYVLAALIILTAMIYFIVAWQAFGEMASEDSVEGILGSKMEIALFSTVGFGYFGVLVWILRRKLHTFVPYAITAIGSSIMIGVYLVAITIGIPVVGIETETDPFATISKTLQGTIIGICAFLIPFTMKVPLGKIATR